MSNKDEEERYSGGLHGDVYPVKYNFDGMEKRLRPVEIDFEAPEVIYDSNLADLLLESNTDETSERSISLIVKEVPVLLEPVSSKSRANEVAIEKFKKDVKSFVEYYYPLADIAYKTELIMTLTKGLTGEAICAAQVGNACDILLNAVAHMRSFFDQNTPDQLIDFIQKSNQTNSALAYVFMRNMRNIKEYMSEKLKDLRKMCNGNPKIFPFTTSGFVLPHSSSKMHENREVITNSLIMKRFFPLLLLTEFLKKLRPPPMGENFIAMGQKKKALYVEAKIETDNKSFWDKNFDFYDVKSENIRKPNAGELKSPIWLKLTLTGCAKLVKYIVQMSSQNKVGIDSACVKTFYNSDESEIELALESSIAMLMASLHKSNWDGRDVELGLFNVTNKPDETAGTCQDLRLVMLDFGLSEPLLKLNSLAMTYKDVPSPTQREQTIICRKQRVMFESYALNEMDSSQFDLSKRTLKFPHRFTSVYNSSLFMFFLLECSVDANTTLKIPQSFFQTSLRVFPIKLSESEEFLENYPSTQCQLLFMNEK